MKNYLKKLTLIGMLTIAGGIYTGGNFENPNKDENMEVLNKRYEEYKASKLEEKLEEEAIKGFYLTPDSLNKCIKQAYKEVGKWPKEFDKRLYRLLIEQESKNNVYAKNKYSGASGLTQVMPETYAGYRDTTNIKKEIFNPINNIGVSLEILDDLSTFCRKNHPDWDNLSLEDKRKTILSCYNAGQGTIKNNAKWDLKSDTLKQEQRDYPKIIMDAYHNPNIKIKTE
jgi:soluble lytic murein transglycosylase-like protein